MRSPWRCAIWAAPSPAVDLEISEVVCAPFAAGLSCLVEDERELGATIIDMGGGTTSLAVFFEGQLLHTAQVPVGGQHVTRDMRASSRRRSTMRSA
ncbi:MAG: cell division FtsA domain-containing protein [Rhodospirillales bacterium]